MAEAVAGQLTGVEESTLTTENVNGFYNFEDVENKDKDTGEPRKLIKVTYPCTVPANMDEAVEFFGGEEQTLKVLRQEVQRRKDNTARPILRTAQRELDWQAVAEEAANGYQPGRRGGYSPKFAASELEGLSADQILERLAAKGMLS